MLNNHLLHFKLNNIKSITNGMSTHKIDKELSITIILKPYTFFLPLVQLGLIQFFTPNTI